MSIFDNMFGGKKAKTGYNFSFGNSSTTKSGEEITPSKALEDATVLSCINTLAQACAQLPLNVVDSTGKSISTPVKAILDRPNDYQTAYAFKYAIVHSLMAYGNVYIRIIKTASSKPVQLVLIEPNKMTVESNAAGIPIYVHNVFGAMPLDEIIHIQDIVAFGAEGKSRVKLAAERIGALKAADALLAETFKNGVSIGYVLNVEPGMDADKFNDLSKGFKESFGPGGANRGGATVIQGSTIDSIKGSTPADADLLNLRDRLINEIAAVFKVPSHMVGGTGQEKYSNLRQAQTGFYRDTIAPLVDSIEQSINLKLGDTNAMARFDVSTLLKGDIESQSRVAVQLVNGRIWTPNEARAYIGSSTIEGGDELNLNGTINNPVDDRGSVDNPNGMHEATEEPIDN